MCSRVCSSRTEVGGAWMDLCALIATAVRRDRRRRLKDKGGRRRSGHRRAMGHRLEARLSARRVRAPDRSRHVIGSRSRQSSTDSRAPPSLAVVIGAGVPVMHVANLRALVTSPRAHVRGGWGRRRGDAALVRRGSRLCRRRVYPEVGDPLVDVLPPGQPGQPDAFMEVSFGGDRAWKLSSGALRSSRTFRSCRFFDDALAGSMRRPPRVAAALLTPSPRLDELLGWPLIRLDWTHWRVNGWGRDTR